MRTDVISFALASENRKKIAITIFEYPKRQWSCSALEELTKISHATVFRTLSGLKEFGVLKSVKINKKDILYELAKSPLSKELRRILSIEKTAARRIANDLINKIKSKHILAAILYGSSVKGISRPESDIDILIVLDERNKVIEDKILNIAAEISSKSNKTISAVVMDIEEIDKEKSSQFIKSVRQNMEVIYGKEPF